MSLTLLVVGAVFVLAGCTGAPDQSPDVTSVQQGDSVSADPSMSHIHNLALDGNRLLLGTHEGLWEQRNRQPPQLVGDDPFDVMGLTGTPNRMFASGHPGPGQSGPADLGLIESTDGGTTWDPIALGGQVDFHRLTASGDNVMGVSASDGRLLFSPDGGVSWTSLGTPAVFDLVLDPTDETYVLATTEAGPTVSRDGGQTFSPLTEAPLLALMAWTGSTVYGAAPDGTIYASDNRGKSWSKKGEVAGAPVAIAADGDQVVVLAGSEVVQSIDGGETFSTRMTGIAEH